MPELSIITSQSLQELSDKEFRTIAQFIEQNVGIKMPESKRVMMQSRLLNRLRKLGFKTFNEYIDYVFVKNNSNELVMMIDALTTNKTEFFRERNHFDYLSNTVLPEFSAAGKNMVKIWSAGCSSGEEPYTLAIVMKEFLKNNPKAYMNFSITGTDISTRVLDKAYYAIYDIEIVNQLPQDIKKEYFLKSTHTSHQCARVKNDLRSYVSFRRLNFMDDDFRMPSIYNVIFCRNVLIYFDKPTQEKVIKKFMKYLLPDGYLFLGHSETILSLDLPLRMCAPTVYRKIS